MSLTKHVIIERHPFVRQPKHVAGIPASARQPLPLTDSHDLAGDHAAPPVFLREVSW